MSRQSSTDAVTKCSRTSSTDSTTENVLTTSSSYVSLGADSRVNIIEMLGKEASIDVCGGGNVTLISVDPCICDTARGFLVEAAIVDAARISYNNTKQVTEDVSLIRYLYRHKHTSPFEMVTLKFSIRAPIFVARQIMRHRTASINEESGRYSVIADNDADFYIPLPSEIRLQSKGATSNKQAGDRPASQQIAEKFIGGTNAAYASVLQEYKSALANGIAREQARIVLPVSTFSKWIWKMDLSNLYHFLNLRMAPDAQTETRAYAIAIYELVKRVAPVATQAFEDYQLNSITLSYAEVRILCKTLNKEQPVIEEEIQNKREREEWKQKFAKIRDSCNEQ